MDILELSVDETGEGERVDSYISENAEGMTRSGVQKLITDGKVTVNGMPVTKNRRLSAGDSIRVEIPEPEKLDAVPQDIAIDIVYEDNDLLVVNKPKGMVVHPAFGNTDGTLVNALMYHCDGTLSGINGVIRPGIVHRIDKDTSGLLAVAKTDAAHNGLAAQIKEHNFTREYEAVVCGNLKEDTGFVEAPIGRNPNDRKKMAVTDKNSRYAYTSYEVLERYNGFTYVRLRLKTGRTHQIRVHMAYIGHPVAGDEVYGGKRSGAPLFVKELKGQCLHARKIGFVHPITDEYMEFGSELPEYFTELLKKLKHITR